MASFSGASSETIKRERNKARDLRQSAWWKERLSRGVCYYCEQKFSADQLTMDHKIPLAQGGKSEKSNIVVACKTCNSEKKYFSPVDLILAGNDPYKGR
jgi:5-methylcytosine-specific restriction enzyme A